MFFWILAILLLLVVTAMLLIPLVRQQAQGPAGNADVAIYKAQLREIDRDIARGIVDSGEAERTRAEIGRRLLAADQAAAAVAVQAPKAINRTAIVAIVAMIFGGTALLYTLIGAPGAADLPLQARIDASEEMRATRMSQIEAEQLAAETPLPAPDVSDEYLELIDQLRAVAEARPEDADVWAQLARQETILENYGAAARAQEQAIIILGEDATAQDYMILANQMVGAARGYISPEAENILRIVLEMDPDNTGALYYYGQLFFETDRPDRAFRLFRQVVNTGERDDPFVQLSRRLIEEAAFRAGIDYTLPPVAGPTMEDVLNARDLSDEEFEAMARGMVTQLEDRLATEGGTVQDWAQLITSLSVLGDAEDAAEILREARSVFGAFPEAMEVLDFAAQQAGIVE